MKSKDKLLQLSGEIVLPHHSILSLKERSGREKFVRTVVYHITALAHMEAQNQLAAGDSHILQNVLNLFHLII